MPQRIRRFAASGLPSREGFHATRDFGEEVAGFELEEVFVDEGHDVRGFVRAGRVWHARAVRKGEVAFQLW